MRCFLIQHRVSLQKTRKKRVTYDYSKPRVLIGTRIEGDPDSELSYYPDDPAAEAGRVALSEELELLRAETGDRMFGATTAERSM